MAQLLNALTYIAADNMKKNRMGYSFEKKNRANFSPGRRQRHGKPHVLAIAAVISSTLLLWVSTLLGSARDLLSRKTSGNKPYESLMRQGTQIGPLFEEELALRGALRRIETARRQHLKDTGSEASNTHRSIVWLMSFPNSGTSYTSQLVRDSTHSMTATNYGDELQGDSSVGLVFPNQTEGPFWIPQGDFGLPSSRFVLVKTHCGMRCTDCSNIKYAESTYSFRRKCTLTNQRSHAASSKNGLLFKTYSTEQVKGAIHLVRDPFDNVVSRFHLLMQREKTYPATREGFLEHCLVQDQKFTADEIRYAHFKDNPVLRQLWMVPCHAEFCKYVEWHNLATFVTNDLQLTTLTVHYESYSNTMEAGKRILDFLELEQQSPFPAFRLKTYAEYFTPEERSIVKDAFQFMASRQTWEMIGRYMPP